MNTPLIQGTKIPTLEEKKATELDNADYREEQENATPEKTEEMSDKAGDIFGKNFSPDYKDKLNYDEKEAEEIEDPFSIIDGSKGDTDNPELMDDIEESTNPENKEEKLSIEDKIEELENIQTVENYIETPILKGLYENGRIDVESYENMLEEIVKNPDTNISNIVDGLETENTDTQDELKKVFLEKNETENQKEFNEVLKKHNIDGLEPLKDAIDNKNNDIYEEVSNLIGTSFTKIDLNGDNPEQDIQIAIQTAGNKVLDKYPSIKGQSDSQMYKNAFSSIKSGNIKDGIEGIKNLLLLGSTIAFAGGKINKKYRKEAQKILKGKLKQRVDEIDKQIEKKDGEIKNNKDRKKNTKEIEDLNKEKDEIISGELFKSGKIDVQSELNEKGQ